MLGLIAVFAASGFLLASWGARLPALRESAQLTASEIGLLVSALAAGTLISSVLAGRLVRWMSPVGALKAGARLSLVALLLAAATTVAPVLMICAFLLGFGNGLYDVAMNDRGGRLGRVLKRDLLPLLHGWWSIGALAGALGAAAFSLAGFPLSWHLILAALLATSVTWFGLTSEQPDLARRRSVADPPLTPRFQGWRSRRTISLGLLALGAATAEGAANEWLTLALTDGEGLGLRQSTAAGALGVFILGMVLVRLLGRHVLKKLNTVVALTVSAGLVVLGTAAVICAGAFLDDTSMLTLLVATLGLFSWGGGAALGVPVAMAAAAKDPHEPTESHLHSETSDRVSVISTIGFAAFLFSPLLLSSLGEHHGYQWTLLVAPGVMVPALLIAALLHPRGGELAGRAIPQSFYPIDGKAHIPAARSPNSCASPAQIAAVASRSSVVKAR